MAGEIDETPYSTWATERERRAEAKGAADERARIRSEQAAVIAEMREQADACTDPIWRDVYLDWAGRLEAITDAPAR